MNDHVISGLIRRRRKLTGDLFELVSKADALASDVDALDRTLRLFAPEIEFEAIPALRHHPRPDWATNGVVVRIVRDLLRTAGKPLSTESITAEVLARRGIEGGLTQLHLKRVRKCLDRQLAQGNLSRSRLDGLFCWQLA